MIRHNPKLEEAANVWGLTAGDDIIDLRGKIYITYAGILRHAHAKTERPLRSIRISDPQSAGDTVWMRCTVEVQEPDGTRSTFEGIGDSFSTPKQIPPIRMAETRAKARALRTAYAIPFTGLEEMGEDLQTDDNLRSDLAKLAASPAAKEVIQIAEKDKAEAAAKSKQAERRALDQGDEEKPLPKSPKTILKEAKSEMSEEWKSANKTLRAALNFKGISDDQFKQMLGVESMKDLSPALMRDAIKLLNSPMLMALRQMWGQVASEHTAQLAPLKDLLKDAMERSIPSADPRLSKAKCKGEDCGCEIYWGVSAKQKKNTPVDLGPIRSLARTKEGDRGKFLFVLDANGELDLVDTFNPSQGEQGVQTYIPHYSTCPNAPHFKKGKAA